jgi:hypothetical protein
MNHSILRACCFMLLASSIVRADKDTSFATIDLGNANVAGSGFPCARGNCPRTIDDGISPLEIRNPGRSLALSSQVVQTKKPQLHTTPRVHGIPSKEARSAHDIFVIQPLHDIAQPALVEKQPSWVQPESEILDSQPGVDPYDVGCGPDGPATTAAFPVSTWQSVRRSTA